MTSPSPETFQAGSQAIEQHRSDSPHQQQLQSMSKREKRRIGLIGSLNDRYATFERTKDPQYRAVLQASQVDTTLILQADPYSDSPLPDDPEHIQRLISSIAEPHPGPNTQMINEIKAHAGKFYLEFATEVNNAMEERDAMLLQNKVRTSLLESEEDLNKTLTENQTEYERKLTRISDDHIYRTKLAEEEFAALQRTLRDRAINSVMAKKNRLTKDKEGLDITDSNALLLHPSQYVTTNPASPGGVHGKRTTRNRREIEDQIPIFNGAHKRKRNFHEDDESPAPKRSAMDNGTHTPPTWAIDMFRGNPRNDKPMYSVERLFTDRELGMSYNNAAYAAQYYILSHKRNDDDSPEEGVSPDSGEEPNNKTTEAENGDEAAADTPRGASNMERLPSHATRSKGANNFSSTIGVDAIGDLRNHENFSARLASQIPRVPLFVQTQATFNGAKEKHVPPPKHLDSKDVESDLELIRQRMAQNKTGAAGVERTINDPEWRSLLEACTAPPGTYSAFLLGTPPKPPGLGDEGGVPMSRGPSTDGGVPMGRTASGRGRGRGRGGG